MYHGLEWRQNPTLQSPMCSVSSIGNVFLGDFVQFHIVGILAIGHIVQFVCQVSTMHILTYIYMHANPILRKALRIFL